MLKDTKKFNFVSSREKSDPEGSGVSIIILIELPISSSELDVAALFWATATQFESVNIKHRVLSKVNFGCLNIWPTQATGGATSRTHRAKVSSPLCFGSKNLEARRHQPRVEKLGAKGRALDLMR